MEDLNKEKVYEVCRYFPNSMKLIKKMEKFLFHTFPSIENVSEKKQKLQNLLIEDFNERADLFRRIGFENPKFIYIEDCKSIEEMIWDDNWSERFHDFVDYSRISDDKKTSALYDALYGLTHDFDYRLYLFEPLLTINYSMEALHEFKKRGGIYIIVDDTVYYSFR
jgi:hypothetical protein